MGFRTETYSLGCPEIISWLLNVLVCGRGIELELDHQEYPNAPTPDVDISLCQNPPWYCFMGWYVYSRPFPTLEPLLLYFPLEPSQSVFPPYITILAFRYPQPSRTTVPHSLWSYPNFREGVLAIHLSPSVLTTWHGGCYTCNTSWQSPKVVSLQSQCSRTAKKTSFVPARAPETLVHLWLLG